MADFSIKPTAGTGNKLIIKDQAGGTVLETSNAGSTLSNTVLASTVTGHGGVLEYDHWRLSTAFDGSAAPIASNLIQSTYSASSPDRQWAGKIGTGMSQSSGVFTFPSTGYWEVSFQHSCGYLHIFY